MANITANTIFVQGTDCDISPNTRDGSVVLDGEYIVNSKVIKGSTYAENSDKAPVWDSNIRLPWNIIKIPENPNFDHLSISYGSGGNRQTVDVIPEKIESEKSTLKVLNDNDVSQAMLRTNPRLTGNVKVVIDSNSDIFIDTFKVNDVLANKKYHKVPVSYKDYYGKNLMSIFNKMTSKDFYDIPNKYKELLTVTSKWEDQYVTTYESGCQTNQDKLYSENFSLLSPLYVNHVLPDFFVIFRIDNVGEFTFDELVKKGKQIAVYDFRDGTKLGTYLRTIQKNAEKYNDGIFISTPTSEDPNTYYENCITGISIDKGVITQQHESAQRNPATNDIWNNYYFIQAYGNHRIVHPRLINFEFMFDDNTSENSQFEVNTYFGVYLYANKEVENIHTTIKDGKVIWINDESDDASNPHIIYDDSINLLSKNLDTRIIAGTNYIAAYTSDDWFQRIYEDTKRNELKNKKSNVGKNLLYLNAKPVDEEISKGVHSFLTMTLNTKIKAGEHYKFISYPKSTVANDIVIYEIAFTNAERYKSMQISDMHTTYYSHSYSRDTNTDTRKITTYRISCYVSEDDTIEKQISNIRKIMLKFDYTPFRVTYTTKDTICICYMGEDDMEFQRISSEYASDAGGDVDETKLSNYIGRRDITFFGDVNVDEFPINPLDEANTVYDSYENGAYVPIDFENLGARLSLNTAFIDVNSTTNVKGYITNYQINGENINKTGNLLYGDMVAKSNELVYDTGKIDDEGNAIYKTIENTVVNKFKIKTKVLENGVIKDKIVDINLIDSYTGKNVKLVQLYTIEKPTERKDALKLGLYLPYYINYGRCGFMPICDFDFIIPYYYYDILYKDTKKYICYDSKQMVNTIKTSSNYSKYDTILPIDTSFISNEIYNEGQRYSDISIITPENITWSFSSYPKQDNLTIDGSIIPVSNEKYEQLENFTSNAKNDILNGAISISDIIPTITDGSINNGSKETIKIYKIEKNKTEFIFNGYKYKMLLNNSNILNENDINNMYIYICKAHAFPGSNNWDIFISKQENKILIMHYEQTKETKDKQKQEILNEKGAKIYYLNIQATANDINYYEKETVYIKSTPIKISKNKSYIIYSNNATLYYGYDINDKTFKQNIVSKYGGRIELKTISEIKKYMHGNEKIYLFEILNNDESIDIPSDNNVLNENNLYSVYIKNGNEKYSDYTNTNIVTISNPINHKENYYTYFYPNKKTDNYMFGNKYNTLPMEKSYGIRRALKIYSDKANYCFDASNIPVEYSFFIYYAFPTNISSFKNNIFYYEGYKVKITDKNKKELIEPKSYSTLDTGIMIKNFLNSPALLLKNKYHNTITLNNWENIHTNNGKIYFNVSSALTKKISSSDGLSRLFKSLGTENGKQIFIDNTILPKIHLSINDTITVYKTEYTGSLYSSSYLKDMTIDKNAKAELILQNNVYYVELTPSDTNKTYYITYTNKLT